MVQTKRPRSRREMPAVHPDAAAIDVGATMHVVAVPPDRDPEPVRTFGTFTADLHRLADWLRACRIKSVVMESTGVYWIPIFEILEQKGFDVQLVNARDAKHVPGRKTDVSAMRNGCNAFTNTGSCVAVSNPKGRSRRFAPTSGSASDYWILPPPTSNTCRKR